MLADAARRQTHGLHQHVLELRFVDLSGAVQVRIDRQRLGDADGVGELQRAAVGEAGRHDVLGEIARRVGGRAVDLGGVLAREGAAAVRSRSAVGVDDDLAAGQPAVAVGAADEELARRIDVPDSVLRDEALGQRLQDVGLGQRLDIVRGQMLVDMLMRQDDLGHADRLAVLVTDRDLALGIGAEALLGARAARLRQVLQDAVGIVDRRRHQFRRLPAGVAEHDALVAGTLFLVAGLVDARPRCRPTAHAAGSRPWRSRDGSRPARSRCP